MVGPALPMNKRKPEWLSNFLHTKFFDACVDHIDLPKNENKIFCIDCNLCCCKHCISSVTHCLHRYLQIYKCTYQDVVRLEDMQKHLDCSKIQTFKANGEKTVHLNPAPGSKHSTPLKSKTTTATGASCEACGRNIHDLPNCFCSVACKVLIDSSEILRKDQSQEMIAISVLEFDGLSEKQSLDLERDKDEHESSRENQAIVSSALKPKGRLRKRKGVPRRAPFS